MLAGGKGRALGGEATQGRRHHRAGAGGVDDPALRRACLTEAHGDGAVVVSQDRPVAAVVGEEPADVGHVVLGDDPEQAILGLREVARLRASLVGLQGALGIAGEPQAVFDALRADPRFQFGDAQSILAGYAALHDRVDARLPALFLRQPQATFAVRPVEGFRAASATAASYSPQSAAGAHAGVLYVNTSELASRPSYALDALYLGEAVPGHIYLAAIAQETPNLPRFRRFGDDAAMVAGWALYAQLLGAELGLYADPYSQFGGLNVELSRAAALVVDTGLHAQGWTRQRAEEYLRANTALGAADIAVALDRYVACPGEALAARIGQLKILELRRRAEQRLGARFDLREFHEQVIGSGILPLSVLETRINRWIEARR